MNEQTAIAPMQSKRAVEVRPERPLGWLREEIDRLFDDFAFSRAPRSIFSFPGLAAEPKPAVELIEKGDGYLMSVELPGLADKDVDIELADGILTISGEKHDERESKDSGYLISERSYGAFRREFTLPNDVDAETLKAKMNDGVLTLEMKKDKSAASRSRKIAIG